MLLNNVVRNSIRCWRCTGGIEHAYAAVHFYIYTFYDRMIPSFFEKCYLCSFSMHKTIPLHFVKRKTVYDHKRCIYSSDKESGKLPCVIAEYAAASVLCLSNEIMLPYIGQIDISGWLMLQWCAISSIWQRTLSKIIDVNKIFQSIMDDDTYHLTWTLLACL